MLQLYRDPKTFSLKNLVYSSEEELLADMALGVQAPHAYIIYTYNIYNIDIYRYICIYNRYMYIIYI